MNIERAREKIKILRIMKQDDREFGKTSSQIHDTARTLKNLVGNPTGEGNAKGSKLVTAGVALLAFPDPTISDLVGPSLIAAGVIRNRMPQPTIADVYREIRKTKIRLNSLTSELNITSESREAMHSSLSTTNVLDYIKYSKKDEKELRS